MLHPSALALRHPDARLTWAGFADDLRRQRIWQGSGSWAEYERAKKLVESLAQDSQEYQQLITWAAQFIGV